MKLNKLVRFHPHHSYSQQENGLLNYEGQGL